MIEKDRIKTYGLIGRSLDHSFSPTYFKNKFEKEGISNAIYQSFPLAEINDFLDLLHNKNISGLNVTIPYKKLIIPYLNDLSEAATAVGAVNCIEFRNGRLKGHNTDVLGFEKSLKPLLSNEIQQALILGSGGAANAVAYVLEKLNLPYRIASRNEDRKYVRYVDLEGNIANYQLIINTTPVGMFPNETESPLANLDGVGPSHLIYDLIYNPSETELLKQARALGARIKNGQEMLEIQAEESWLIWEFYG